MSRKRVFVTGMGIVCPLGQGIDEFWRNLCEGRSGVCQIERFDPQDSSCRVAGMISDFRPQDHFRPRELRACEPFAQFGIVAARQAWTQANGNSLNPERVAVVGGTGIGGIVSYKPAYDALYLPETGQKINAYTIPRMMNNALSAHIALDLKVKGRNLTLNTACSSGANAIGLASEWLQDERYDAVLCGGSEAPVTYELLRTWEAMGVLSRSRELPEKACRPFGADRDGFVLCEGAAMLVLESEASCQRREQSPLAEILGFASSCDATSLTSPDLEGVLSSMKQALNDAQLTAAEIDSINLHGTGTKMNDQIEGNAIAELFETSGVPLAVANKAQLGHAMGASSAIEATASVLSLRHQMVPPTLNCENPDPACRMPTLSRVAREHSMRTVLTNSFAFGGSNACLVMGRCH